MFTNDHFTFTNLFAMLCEAIYSRCIDLIFNVPQCLKLASQLLKCSYVVHGNKYELNEKSPPRIEIKIYVSKVDCFYC